MKNQLILSAVLLCAPSARAESDDCLFDGACSTRPSIAVAAEAEPSAVSRLDGLKKGASEGAMLGFLGTLTPAVAMVDEGFGRRFSRGYDGARSDNDNGGLYYYGGMALAAILYIPALVVGGIGGLFGAAAGTAAPESAQDWNAEEFLVGKGPRKR